MPEEQGQGTSAPEGKTDPTTMQGEVAAPVPPNPEAEPAVVTPSGTKGQYTQEDLNKIAGNVRVEERNKAQRDAQQAREQFLQELGVSDLEAAKAAVQSVQQAEEARMGELEKLQKSHEKTTKERDQVKADLEGVRSELNAMRQSSALQVALLESGVNPERVEAAKRLVDSSALDFDAAGNVTGIEDAIEGAKKLAPELFQAPLAALRSVGSNGSNPPVEPPSTGPKDAWSMSEEEYRALANSVKTSASPRPFP